MKRFWLVLLTASLACSRSGAPQTIPGIATADAAALPSAAAPTAAAAPAAGELDTGAPAPAAGFADEQAAPVAAAAPAAEAAAPAAASAVVEGGLERVSFTIRGPLEESMRGTVGAELLAPLAQVTARLLVWWVNVARDLRQGDTVEVLFQQIPGKEPLVQALRFASGKHGKEFRAYVYQPSAGRFAHYYDETGTEVEERLENSPIDDYEQVTSILRDGRGHKGVDWKTPVGSPVKLPFDATLTRKNWGWKRNGNALEFQDGAGRRIVFLHLAELPKSLAVGTHFRAGAVVAQSGNTGRSTAPHLHYQLENAAGKVLDPFRIHRTYRQTLPQSELSAFAQARARFDALFSGGAAATASAPASP